MVLFHYRYYLTHKFIVAAYFNFNKRLERFVIESEAFVHH